MAEIKVFHLLWEKFNWQELDLEKLKEKKHKGVYQIYGTHHVYGKDSLLYIGQTKEQTFGQRLNPDQHWDFNVNHFTEISDIYIGMLLDRDDADRKKYNFIIDDIEYLLINSHCPAFNSTNLKGLKEHKPKNEFIIINWGNYGQMLPEISTLKFSSKYWDNELYQDILLYK